MQVPGQPRLHNVTPTNKSIPSINQLPIGKKLMLRGQQEEDTHFIL